MGSSNSTEKKSPSKEHSPCKNESPKKTETPKKTSESCNEITPPKIKVTDTNSESASKAVEQMQPLSTQESSGVSEEDLASVEAATKALKLTAGGQSLEITLSPAVKKPKSRVSPPTSPTSNQETIAKKLQEAEERKQILEQEKLQKLSAKLEKIPSVQEKKEKILAEKSELIKEKIETKLNNAEENRKRQIDEVKDKISEHTSKIEKAQQALEAAIEAAKEATKAGLNMKMSKNEENKNEQFKEMMNALTEHSDHIKSVRNNMDQKMKPKAQEILDVMAKKEESSRELLAKLEAERLMKIEEKKKHEELVRMNKKLVAESSLTTESA